MTNTFKKILGIALIAVSAIFANAGQDDAMLLFRTTGPDRYADGTPVLEGEVYALVWSRNGHSFAGVTLDGQAVDAANNAIVVALPRGKWSKKVQGVHCPNTMYQLDGAIVDKYADGQFSLVLFDTRVSDGKGGFKVGGAGACVQGWGEVANSRVIARKSQLTNAANGEGEIKAVATTSSTITDDAAVPQPVITGIQVQDDCVVLTVKGTDARLLYNVASGDKPNCRANRHAARAAKQGHARADREITIVVPKAEGQNFFKVVRN